MVTQGEVFLFYIFRIHFLGGFFGPLELMVFFLFSPVQSYLLGILRKKAVRSSGSSNCPLKSEVNLLFNFRGEISMKSLIRSIHSFSTAGFFGWFQTPRKELQQRSPIFFDKNPWGFSKRCWWSMLQSPYNHNENLKTQHTPRPRVFLGFLGLVLGLDQISLFSETSWNSPRRSPWFQNSKLWRSKCPRSRWTGCLR